MALQLFNKDMNIILPLDDEPNDVGGLTADELKRKFDEGGLAIQEFLNTVLVPALESLGVESILRRGDERLMYLRMDNDGGLEYSTDGSYYRPIGTGHVLQDSRSIRYPNRRYLKFLNAELEDSDIATHVRVTPSWDEVKNKPMHGETETLFEWFPGYAPIDRREQDDYRGWYKVSDTPLSKSELLRCVVDYTGPDTYHEERSTRIVEDMLDDLVDGEERTAVNVSLHDYIELFAGLDILSVPGTFSLDYLGFYGMAPFTSGLWVCYDYPTSEDSDKILAIRSEMESIFNKEVLPPIEADDLPDIPKSKLPKIESGDLPDIPVEKLPDIPKDKLPEIAELPAVTTMDNGKHLEVVAGEWMLRKLPENNYENWTFTLEDGSTVTKAVCIK